MPSTSCGFASIKDVDARHKACARAGRRPDPSAGHDEESPKANPVAAAEWASADAAISCRAPRMSPPPSIVSIAAMPKGSTPEPFSILSGLCRARRRWRSCSIIHKPLKMRTHSAQLGLDRVVYMFLVCSNVIEGWEDVKPQGNGVMRD